MKITVTLKMFLEAMEGFFHECEIRALFDVLKNQDTEFNPDQINEEWSSFDDSHQACEELEISTDDLYKKQIINVSGTGTILVKV